MAFQRFVIVL